MVGEKINKGIAKAIKQMETLSGVMSVSMAVENLMLYAHARGWGTSCMTGPLVAADEIKKILKIPSSWNIAAVVPVGHPGEIPPPTPRRPVQQVITWVDADWQDVKDAVTVKE
ncbi:MAG: nitroreductase family protein [Deltaproteobacteria bacterium]|nr:nitroreductase family protein [Deltaproteobacteria bacterium]